MYEYTQRGNLVAVVSNGTAVLGRGDIGPLGAKPVMEGKAVLFKRFAEIDVFDLEVASMPGGTPVKRGGWLAIDGDGTIYATRGNKTFDFMAYEPLQNTWAGLAPMPGGPRAKML